VTDTDLAPLYVAHPRALAVLYADVERHAFAQQQVFVGTAGAVLERENAGGFRFYARQWYDAEGKKREAYVAGPIGDPQADTTAEALRARIKDLKELVPSLRMLGREGFHLADPRTYAAIAALHNHWIFAAGGILVGSHAYGVLLNRLGVNVDPYTTEDVDIARRETLAFDKVPERGFVEMLNESGIHFVEVPGPDHRRPATSFKLRGRSRFHVDLLAPSRDETYPVVAVPELRAHAVGLPYLGYLLAASQPGAVIAREGCCAVRVPLPERFAIHKLVVSQLRTGREEKGQKDVHQASILLAVLGDTHPGAIESAVAELPRRAAKHLRAAMGSTRRILETRAPRAWEELAARR
jgi:hypothetical protein